MDINPFKVGFRQRHVFLLYSCRKSIASGERGCPELTNMPLFPKEWALLPLACLLCCQASPRHPKTAECGKHQLGYGKLSYTSA